MKLLRTERRRDAGVSMTELVVAMMIMSLVVIATTTLTIGFERTTAENVARQDQIDAGRVAMARISRNLRMAVSQKQLATSCTGCPEQPFVSAGRFGMTFYANIDNKDGSVGPSRVTYSVGTVGGVPGVLQESILRPNAAAPGVNGWAYCDPAAASATADCRSRLTTRRLATGVLTDGPPLFAYFQQGGAPLSAPSTGLPGGDLGKVTSVELTARVGSTGAVRPVATTYVQRVLLGNAIALQPQTGATP
ncbi:PulJ/GspJ family protein [Cellulomonas iranensis]|uniref:PulJ/GspJ family protein n=1 Tax=Cellulomonas iranensis TaxID=76862 RepID=UPI003D7C94B9